jgi:hypothetical protein
LALTTAIVKKRTGSSSYLGGIQITARGRSSGGWSSG